MLGESNTHAQKVQTWPLSLTFKKKINTKWIKDLNGKIWNNNIVGGHTEKTPQDLVAYNKFLDKITKTGPGVLNPTEKLLYSQGSNCQSEEMTNKMTKNILKLFI